MGDTISIHTGYVKTAPAILKIVAVVRMIILLKYCYTETSTALSMLYMWIQWYTMLVIKHCSEVVIHVYCCRWLH